MGGHGVSFKILETRSPTLDSQSFINRGTLDEGIIMGKSFLSEKHPEIFVV